jgi:hypothetical protein
MRDLKNLNKEHDNQLKICQTVRELIDTINHCCYERNDDTYGKVLICNLCAGKFLSFQDVLEHILEYHKKDTIPDVDPTK